MVNISRQIITMISSVIVIGLTLTFVFVFINFGEPQPVYVDHDPIVIWNDNDFEAYGFPGTGTSDDPYMIENYRISRTTTYCIYISGTTKSFRIENCLIGSEDSTSLFTGIYITDVSGYGLYITNNKIQGVSVGIEIRNSHFIRVDNNEFSSMTLTDIYDYEIDTGSIGIKFDGSTNCASRDNIFRESDHSVILIVEYSYDCNLNDNIIYNGGIFLKNSDRIRVNNNEVHRITESRDYPNYGIAIDNSVDLQLSLNRLYGCGFNFLDSPYDFLRSHYFETNWINDKIMGFFTETPSVLIDVPNYGQLFFIELENLTIVNQVIQKTDIGISLYSCNNFELRNIDTSDCAIGIFAYDCSNIVYDDISCSNNVVGIKNLQSSNVTVNEAVCSFNDIGILNAYCENANVTNSECHSNYIGIHHLVSGGLIDSNVCNNNFIGIQYWYGFDDDEEKVISNNTCNDNTDSGIIIAHSKNVIVQDNLCSNNDFTGIYLVDVYFFECVNNTADYNSIGLLFHDDFNGSIIGNSAYRNDNGFDMSACGSLTVSNNSMNKNDMGIVFYGTSNSVIRFNLFKNSEWYALMLINELYISVNNIIYHNAFIDDSFAESSQAFDEGIGNIWYDIISSEGNFWSEWISGPYSIDGIIGSEDLYPLASNPL